MTVDPSKSPERRTPSAAQEAELLAAISNEASIVPEHPAAGEGATRASAPLDLDGNAPLRDKDGRRITPRSPRAALEPERIAEPTKYSKRARHPLVIAGNAVFTIVVLVVIAAGLAFAIGKQRFEAPGPNEAEKVVNIPRSGIREVADLLQREGVIEHPWVFVGSVMMLKARDELKSGEYLFPKQASLRDVIDTIIEGRVVQHQLTIPEGLTSEQITERLLENNILSGVIKEIPKEGTLLPETYKFTRGMTREQMIQRMQQSQKRVLQEIWERRSPDLPIKTPEQLVVLASIVEKETGRSDERTRVAAVFTNRLKQRMRLQSDPTIIYGLVGGKGTLGRQILKSEIEQPTPYNTYVIEGLPPGPIANPGRASLEAAANPSRTKDLFFVADGTGGHAFSETLEQHQRHVAKLRLLEQHQREAAKGGTPPPEGEAPKEEAANGGQDGAAAQRPNARRQQQQQRQQQQPTRGARNQDNRNSRQQ